MRSLQIVLFYSRYDTFQITFWYSWSPIYVLNIFMSGLLSLGFTFITPLYTSWIFFLPDAARVAL